MNIVYYTLTWKLNGNVGKIVKIGKNTGNSFNCLYIYIYNLLETLERILETTTNLALLMYKALIQSVCIQLTRGNWQKFVTKYYCLLKIAMHDK